MLNALEDGKTIREIALQANVAYLTPYYLVQRKETVSVPKDVLVVAPTKFYQGTEARNFLGIPTHAKTTIEPNQIPAGAQAFVQSSSHNRKIPIGSRILLQTSTNADPNAPSARVPAACTAPPTTFDTEVLGDFALDSDDDTQEVQNSAKEAVMAYLQLDHCIAKGEDYV